MRHPYRRLAPRLCALLLLVPASACRDTPEAVASADQVDTFRVATPVRRDVTLERTYVADVRAVQYAELRARAPGVIESVAVDEGQTVKAGQLLFTINAKARSHEVDVARAASDGARAELATAELEARNTLSLQEKDIVSEAEVARTRATVELQKARLGQSRAQLARASTVLSHSRVRAPFAGVVHRIPSRAGSMVSENALLTTLSDSHDVLAYFAVSERVYLAQREATPDEVLLALADGSIFSQPGRIDAVGSEVDVRTGTITYRARFANPDGTLKHGSSAKVILRSKLKGVLVVPVRSTFEIQGNTYVYVVDAAGTARSRKLVVKTRVGDDYVIDEGLAPDDRYVREGALKLRDGARVTVEATPASKV